MWHFFFQIKNMKMTLVDMFDDLVRNSKVLQDSCEEQFIRLVLYKRKKEIFCIKLVFKI